MLYVLQNALLLVALPLLKSFVHQLDGLLVSEVIRLAAVHPLDVGHEIVHGKVVVLLQKIVKVERDAVVGQTTQHCRIFGPVLDAALWWRLVSERLVEQLVQIGEDDRLDLGAGHAYGQSRARQRMVERLSFGRWCERFAQLVNGQLDAVVHVAGAYRLAREECVLVAKAVFALEAQVSRHGLQFVWTRLEM